MPKKLREMSSHFRNAVLEVVRAIPSGSVMSYGEVAIRAGYVGAARAVGSLMKQNHDPSVPCHRVVKSDGTIGEYNGGIEIKVAKLRQEGVCITRVDDKRKGAIQYNYSIY
jgi:O-6-methylguanine DNA methyltransferase